MNTRVTIEFSNVAEAHEFTERMEKNQGHTTSYQAELLGLTVKDAKVVAVDVSTTREQMTQEVKVIRDVLDNLIEREMLRDIFHSRQEIVGGITNYSEFYQICVDIRNKIDQRLS